MMASVEQAGEVASPGVGTRRRWWRVAVIGLAVILLLLAAALVALRRAYPPERLAALLSEQVTATTGRAFRIEGGLSIHLLPTISVRAGDVILGNADWGSQPDMIRLRNAAFEVSLRELLDGRIRVLSIDMEDADVLLESDGDNRFNWHLAPHPQAGGKGAQRIAVEELSIKNARITYRDGRRGVLGTVTVDALDIEPQSDDLEHLSVTFRFGPRQWEAGGEIGHLGDLQAGTGQWPFDIRLTTDGASIAASGNIGTAARAGLLEAKVSAHLDTAEALAHLSPAMARLPMPIEASGTLLRSPGEWRVESMQASLNGEVLTGRVSLRTAPTSRLDADLSATALDLAKWQLGTGAPKPPASAQRAQFFGDAALPFDALPALPIQIALKAERLNVPGMPPLSGLSLRWMSEEGRLTVEPLAFSVAGGEVRGRMVVSNPRSAPPHTEVQMTARSLSVESLDAQWGGGRHFKSGHANLDLKLAMTGRTPRSLAASSTGDVQLVMRDVSLAGRAAALDQDIVARVLDMLVPKQGPRQELVVQCAVARLPLRNGVAMIDRSIAMETSQLSVTASGDLNLAKQTVELAFRPRVKKGLDLNPATLVQLMLVKGPLERPELSIDPKGTVRQAANYGVAAATGGLSLLAPALLGGVGEPAGCGVAASASQRGAKPQAPTPSHGLKLPRPFSALRQSTP
ncbi:AsmA family protein [Variovorax sp. GT1P44]|uniref:AsmA family protein n=1 Tax=Variovorax sp. GT1P44 TaxID=3443742 RepID=UPI003F4712AC